MDVARGGWNDDDDSLLADFVVGRAVVVVVDGVLVGDFEVEDAAGREREDGGFDGTFFAIVVVDFEAIAVAPVE